MHPQRSLIHVEGDGGPFDLLLELIRERKLDVSALSLREITDDFLTYLTQHTIRPEFLGDFLIVAATLLLIKTRRLSLHLESDEEEEVEQLTQRLAAYQDFRAQGQWIGRHWGRTPLFSLGSFAPESRAAGKLPRVSVEHLVVAMLRMRERLPKPIAVRAYMRPRGKSLQECIDFFWVRLAALEQVVFQQAVSGNSRQDVAMSFLAILELARQQQIELTQTGVGSELMISRV